MLKFVLTLLLLLVCTATAAIAADRVEDPKTCQQCRMDRTLFPHSRMLVVYADGTRIGVCSIQCAAGEMMNHKDKRVKTLLAADYASKILFDATDATWVVGGKQKGVMTFVAKWAFAREQDARQFIKKNGGKIVDLDQVMKLATAEVREMRK